MAIKIKGKKVKRSDQIKKRKQALKWASKYSRAELEKMSAGNKGNKNLSKTKDKKTRASILAGRALWAMEHPQSTKTGAGRNRPEPSGKGKTTPGNTPSTPPRNTRRTPTTPRPGAAPKPPKPPKTPNPKKPMGVKASVGVGAKRRKKTPAEKNKTWYEHRTSR